jgi:hypothetical protein
MAKELDEGPQNTTRSPTRLKWSVALTPTPSTWPQAPIDPQLWSRAGRMPADRRHARDRSLGAELAVGFERIVH